MPEDRAAEWGRYSVNFTCCLCSSCRKWNSQETQSEGPIAAGGSGGESRGRGTVTRGRELPTAHGYRRAREL